MTRCLLFFLVPLLYAADSRIDHATLAGKDLKALQAKLAAVGISTVYGGPHNNRATEMSIASFPDGSYLELMGIQPQADPEAVSKHPWAKCLQEEAGPCAWAIREKDLAAEVKRLKDAGVTVSALEASGRTRPDGVRLEWETSAVGAGTRGQFFPFLIQDKTPRAQRVYPQGKPTTKDFRGIARIVIAVRHLDDAIARYRQAYGSPPPIKQTDREFGAYMALIGNLPVVLAQPLNAASWLTARIERFGEGPCAFVLAAENPRKFQAASTTRWFGAAISWFNADKLGWRLGFEAAR